MIDQLIHQIKIRQAELKESMAIGNPSTFEAYQRMVGHCHGLNDVLAMIDDLLREDRDE